MSIASKMTWNEKSMYPYIIQQPEALKSILDNRKELTAAFVRLYQQVRPDRIYIIGSGTSQNGAKIGREFMEHVLGIDVFLNVPSKLPAIRGERPLLIFVSQGGSSTNTVAAIEALKAYPMIALVGEEKCKINEICPNHVLIGCPLELAGPKTLGYTSTIMAFYMMAIEAAHETGLEDDAAYEARLASLYESVSHMAENIRRTEAWFDRNADDLKQIGKYAVVGKYIGGLTADESALKILETVLVPATGYEFEEFLHGPMSMFAPDLGVIYHVTEDPTDKPRMLSLAKVNADISKYVYLITSDETIEGSGVLHLLSNHCPFCSVFEYILPCQMIGAVVPTLLGIQDKGHALFERVGKDVPIKTAGGR